MASVSDQRRKEPGRYDILNATPEQNFDAITKLAATICNAPFAAISFLDADRQCIKFKVGLELGHNPISESICRSTFEHKGVLVVNDTTQDLRFLDKQSSVSGVKVRLYAGCAIRARDGTAIGTICVLDAASRPQGLTLVERSTLEVLARQIEIQLELRMAMKEQGIQLADMRQLSERLAFRGSHDALTAIPNRGHFDSHLRERLSNCDQTNKSLTLVLIDLDNFKQTNDALGHDAGDALLCGLASNLKSFLRPADYVARLGGDEFSIIMTDVAADGPDRSAIDKLCEQIRLPITHRGQTLECQASVGLATYPKDAVTADALSKCSDLALAAAKLERNSAVIFNGDLLASFETNLRAVGKVRECLASDSFTPFYQPKVDFASGQCAGFEALFRWRHPQRVNFPSIFDPDFPDKPLIAKIGLRMIEKILDDMQEWAASGLKVGKIAINSSTVDFARDDFAENLLAQLKERSISPKAIEIEITECVFLGRGVPHIVRALRVLREAGVSIALDDFGTGYASLTHLRQFPIDVLKIDQTFIGGITRSPDDAAIVRAVIGLSKNLGLISVAEGIETLAHEAFVRHHGCDLGQGYLYGMAIPAHEVAAAYQQITRAA